MAGITTTVLAGASAALSLGKGISDISKGKKLEREARRKRENYQMPELRNVYAGMAVPTSGVQMQKDSALQTQTDLSYMVGQSGARAAIGAAPGLAESTRRSMESIGAQLEQSEFRLQQMIAEDEARIRNIREQRAYGDLQGLGTQEAYGQSLQQAGSGRLVSTLGSAANLSAAFSGDADAGNRGEENSPAPLPSQSPNFSEGQIAQSPGNLSLEQPALGYRPTVQPWQERIGLNYNFNPNI